MDRQTYEQLDRIEGKLDILIRKLAPEVIKEGEEIERA